jgi:hypothetical protein
MAGALQKGWLRQWMTEEGWTMGFSNLSRWAHWITPKIRSHRFDTRFYVAFMPRGQECFPDRREMTHGVWITPQKGLEANLRGEIPLSPPTLVTLQQLLSYSDSRRLEKELKNRPWGEPFQPHLLRLPKGVLYLLPWDRLYDREGEIDTSGLGMETIPVGEPFSRLWYHKGILRPVRA